jgi:hypothetical protein
MGFTGCFLCANIEDETSKSNKQRRIGMDSSFDGTVNDKAIILA